MFSIPSLVFIYVQRHLCVFTSSVSRLCLQDGWVGRYLLMSKNKFQVHDLFGLDYDWYSPNLCSNEEELDQEVTGS